MSHPVVVAAPSAAPRLLPALGLALLLGFTAAAEVGKPQEVAPGVWFHEGDLARKGHCNNGWIIFRDYVLVVDANWPDAARELLPKIRATTDKPIKFVFDTHHHGDHAYGNQVWVDQGATIVAHEGVLSEMKKVETGLFGSSPGRWEDEAKKRPDMAGTKLAAPTMVFSKTKVFDDGVQHVELIHLGTGHTRGDAFAWLPKERILFTGDACVNGPYNFMGDGETGEWVKSLNEARALGPKFICPGHGLMGSVEILDNQLDFIRTLRSEVHDLVRLDKSAADVKAAVEGIKARIQKNPNLANYVGGMFTSQVEKVYVDHGGKPFASVLWLTPETRAGLQARSLGKPDYFADFAPPH